MAQPMTFVGIDVSKATLDVASRPTASGSTVANDDAGIAVLMTSLQQLRPTLIVLEATGGYELPVVRALVEAALPVIVANPRHVRDFAKATGRLAKTDLSDQSYDDTKTRYCPRYAFPVSAACRDEAC